MEINKINIKKSKVELIIDNKIYQMTYQAYTNLYLYEKKKLADEEFNLIKLEDKNFNINSYLDKLLANKRYTIKDIKNKLYLKFKIKDVDPYLTKYIESNILNDYEYVINYLESRNSLCYGKNYFLLELKKRGISDEILKNENINILLNQNNKYIDEFISKLDKKKQNLFINKRKDYIISYLLNKGFEIDLIKNAINNYSFDINEKEIETLINKKISDIKRKYKDKDKYYIRNKIINSLLNIGVEYSKINKYLD